MSSSREEHIRASSALDEFAREAGITIARYQGADDGGPRSSSANGSSSSGGGGGGGNERRGPAVEAGAAAAGPSRTAAATSTNLPSAPSSSSNVSSTSSSSPASSTPSTTKSTQSAAASSSSSPSSSPSSSSAAARVAASAVRSGSSSAPAASMPSLTQGSKDPSDAIARLRSAIDDMKIELQQILTVKEKKNEDLQEYLDLRTTLQALHESKQTTKLETQVDLGHQIYMQAVIPDASRIFVDIGFDLRVEMTIPEALKFIDEKEALMRKTIDKLSRQAADRSARIKVMYEGIGEILHLQPEQIKQRRPMY